ncbi:MAG: low-complexity protein [Chromatiales bacterium]
MAHRYCKKPVAAAIGAAFVGTLGMSGLAGAADNPFGLSELDSGYMQLASSHGEGKCGEGKCGEGMMEKEKAEGQCGEGMVEKEKAEGQCGEGMMEKEKTEGKCGEGKCGAK